MLFTDPVFLTKFLPLVLLGFFATLFSKTRWHSQILLIGASLVFYSWFKSEYLILLVGSMGVNYVLAKYILAQPGTSKSKRILVIGIVVNLLLLGVYKYLGFLTVNFNALFDLGLPDPKLLLPLAISFFTFQQISYATHCGAYCPSRRDDAAISENHHPKCSRDYVLRRPLSIRPGPVQETCDCRLYRPIRE